LSEFVIPYNFGIIIIQFYFLVIGFTLCPTRACMERRTLHRGERWNGR